jgi:anthranilate synthase component 1/para-aminobenzoate synthetase component 1
MTRYSFMGSEPFMIFKSKGRNIEVAERIDHPEGECRYAHRELTGNPIRALRELMGKFISYKPPELPMFFGGAVGYLSYDIAHFFERLPDTTVDDLRLPEVYLVFTDTLIIFDHLDSTLKVVANVRLEQDWGRLDAKRAYARACRKINSILRSITYDLPESGIVARGTQLPPAAKAKPVESNFTKSGYEKCVEICKEYVRAGDIFQVNISQRLATNIRSSPLEIYAVLREINPSPFAAYLDFPEVHLVSCSPERLMRVENGTVITRPIAGTRPRGRNAAEDKKLAEELINDPKERAEHIMLVDLERNDIGRVCEYGSVHVDELMVLEKYSHVIHIVSNVTGKLVKNKDVFDVLRACFPGGTITGAPKIRAMEIIDELEPVKRGPYTGSIGYFTFAGEMDLNIAIRTIVVKEGRAYAQAGGGVVADSDPEREYYETLDKAQAMLNAIALAESSGARSMMG